MFWKITLRRSLALYEGNLRLKMRGVRLRYFEADDRESAAEKMRAIMNAEGLKQFWEDWDIKGIKRISEAEYRRNTGVRR